MRKLRGFTMVELMVVTLIVGLLLAIGLPAYRQGVRKSNRADAQISLTRLGTLEERFYFRENNYTTDFADIVTGVTSGDPVASDEGNYSIVLSLPSGATAGTAWQMVATAVGDQLNDTDCRTFKLTSNGSKTATTSAGAATTECW